MGPHEIQKVIDNVADDGLRILLREVFNPKGTGPVASSPHFVFIVSHILRGCTPVEIQELVEREKKAFITADSIREYTLQYVHPHLMQQSMVDRWLSKADELDEFQVLKNLAKIQYARVLYRLDKPGADPEEEESRRRDMDSLRKTCLAINKIKSERKGDAPADEKPVDSTVKQTVAATEPAAKLDSRVAAEALKALGSLGINVH